MRRSFSIISTLTAAYLLSALPVQGGGDKAGPWKPVLSDDAYKILTQRSIAGIEAAAKSGAKNAEAKVQVEAAILVGYTLSIKNADADDVAKLRGAALMAGKPDLKKLADFGKTVPLSPKALPDVKDWKVRLPDVDETMLLFKNKAKGGEGIHADLQYLPKLANLNGIEALIGALSAKKLSEANLTKVSKELPLLGYRLAVFGSVTHEIAPEKGKAQWRELSQKMRDASLALADAAHKKNADGIVTAATSLESTCTQCHSVFKSK